MSFADRFVVRPSSRVNLEAIDANAGDETSREQAERKTHKAIAHLARLQYLLFANADQSLLIVLQGPDASGKDGTIKHLFAGLNPQGVKVTSFKKPSEKEARHDFLWRAHARVPASGEIAVFNRSYYEAVLVERVRKLVPRRVWETRYTSINAFEALLAENRTRILKFFLNIDADEQLARFGQRLDDRTKRWKISEEDYADRKLWPQFAEANAAMLEKTSTSIAPWYVIPANRKWYRNFVISKIVVAAMKEMGLTIPLPKVDISKIRRKYHSAQLEG